MKSTLFALLVVVTFSWIATAQNAATPILSLHGHGDASQQDPSGIGFEGVPNLCKPCVFYGGDFNENDPHGATVANGNTLLVPDTGVYAAVKVPKNTHGVITGILFIEIVTQEVFDPDTATYDIRTGVSSGNGGTSVASGTGTMSYQLYGQCQCLEVETAVNLTKALTVTPGTTYWFNLQPQCTNSGDPACSEIQYFFPNTTQETNGLNAAAQPLNEMFFNSTYFGYEWANVCTLFSDPKTCVRGSFGLMGHKG